jgi:hypothetical protein
MARIMAMLFAACVLFGTSSAFAAAGKHRPTHWTAARHALPRTHAHAHARPFATPYDPYAYGASSPAHRRRSDGSIRRKATSGDPDRALGTSHAGGVMEMPNERPARCVGVDHDGSRVRSASQPGDRALPILLSPGAWTHGNGRCAMLARGWRSPRDSRLNGRSHGSFAMNTIAKPLVLAALLSSPLSCRSRRNHPFGRATNA